MKRISVLLFVLSLSICLLAQAPAAPVAGKDKPKVSHSSTHKKSVFKPKATTHSATLSWTNPTGSTLTGNKVYRSTVTGGPYTLVSTLATPGTTFTDSGLTGGTTYYYVVTAVCASCNPQESGNSNQATAVVPADQPAPPTSLTVTGVQ